jgi:hypothetical protein
LILKNETKDTPTRRNRIDVILSRRRSSRRGSKAQKKCFLFPKRARRYKKETERERDGRGKVEILTFLSKRARVCLKRERMGENGRGTITTNLWFCGWRRARGEQTQRKAEDGGKKQKKKEREKGVKTSFRLVPRNIWAKVYILCLKYTLVIYYNSNSLATTRTHTFATNISFSLYR